MNLSKNVCAFTYEYLENARYSHDISFDFEKGEYVVSEVVDLIRVDGGRNNISEVKSIGSYLYKTLKNFHDTYEYWDFEIKYSEIFNRIMINKLISKYCIENNILDMCLLNNKNKAQVYKSKLNLKKVLNKNDEDFLSVDNEINGYYVRYILETEKYEEINFFVKFNKNSIEYYDENWTRKFYDYSYLPKVINSIKKWEDTHKYKAKKVIAEKERVNIKKFKASFKYEKRRKNE